MAKNRLIRYLQNFTGIVILFVYIVIFNSCYFRPEYANDYSEDMGEYTMDFSCNLIGDTSKVAYQKTTSLNRTLAPPTDPATVHGPLFDENLSSNGMLTVEAGGIFYGGYRYKVICTFPAPVYIGKVLLKASSAITSYAGTGLIFQKKVSGAWSNIVYKNWTIGSSYNYDQLYTINSYVEALSLEVGVYLDIPNGQTGRGILYLWELAAFPDVYATPLMAFNGTDNIALSAINNVDTCFKVRTTTGVKNMYIVPTDHGAATAIRVSTPDGIRALSDAVIAYTP